MVLYSACTWTAPSGSVPPLWSDCFGDGSDTGQIHAPHPVYTLELLVEGVMLAEYRGETVKMVPGDVILLAAGERHRLYAGDTGKYRKMFLTLTGSALNALTENMFGSHYLFRDKSNPMRFKENFLRIRKIMMQKESVTDLSAELFRLMMELSVLADSKHTTQLDVILRFMEEHVGDKMTAADFAAELHISRSELDTLFRKHFQTTAAGFFQRMRLQKAMELLRNSRYSIKEIGCAVGYNSGLTFSREFRKHYSMLPGSFRRSR